MVVWVVVWVGGVRWGSDESRHAQWYSHRTADAGVFRRQQIKLQCRAGSLAAGGLIVAQRRAVAAAAVPVLATAADVASAQIQLRANGCHQVRRGGQASRCLRPPPPAFCFHCR